MTPLRSILLIGLLAVGEAAALPTGASADGPDREAGRSAQSKGDRSGGESDRTVSADFDRLYSAHFVVTFQGGDRALARTVSDRLEHIYLAVGRRLYFFPDQAITVVLYPGRRFREATASPAWVGGLFDGAIRLSAERLRQDPAEREAGLRHEYVHALVHRLSGGHVPAWLSEGLALVLEKGEADDRRGLGTDGRRRGDPAPLHRLKDGFLGLSRRAAQEAYAESEAATQLLIRRYGMGRIRDLLASLAEEPDFALAFESMLHDRYGSFEAARGRMSHGGRF